jgi:hypothetical protein
MKPNFPMNTKLWLLGLSGLLFAVAGCTSKPSARLNSKNQANNTPANMTQAAVLPNPPAADLTNSGAIATANPQNANPQNANPQNPAVPVPPNLIPEDSDLGTVGILEERADPFAALPMTPIITRKPKPATPPPAPQAANLTRPQPPQASPLLYLPQAPYPPQPPYLTQAPYPPQVTYIPTSPIPAPVSIPTAPITPPQPQIAMAERIQISGVVELGGSRKVIVQVPNESGSRYVTVGDVLANGLVRVKKVTITNGEPSVVLEQDGKEFIRSVGGMLTDAS